MRLKGVVAQHQRRDLVGHLGEERVALLDGELAFRDRQSEQNLDIDLVIRSVDSGRIVDRVRIDAPPCERIFDASELRATEVAALGEDLASQLAAVNSQRIVGAVSHLHVRLA